MLLPSLHAACIKRDLIHTLKSEILQRLSNSLPHKGEFPLQVADCQFTAGGCVTSASLTTNSAHNNPQILRDMTRLSAPKMTCYTEYNRLGCIHYMRNTLVKHVSI